MAIKEINHILLSFLCLILVIDRYLGIWYSRPEGKTTLYRQQDDFYGTDVPVWVANWNTPMLDQSGILAIDNTDGNLKIFLQGRNPIAVSSVKGARNTSATLLQSGNLVLHEINSDGSAKQLLWQSFDYPTDTLLPGMKLGINLQTGHKWFLQSWISDYSPAQGSFTLGIDNNITNKLIIRWRGEVQRTSADWLDGHFNFSRPWPADYYKFNFTSNEQEMYFNFSVIVGDAKPFSILKINSDGELTDERGALISCPIFGVCGDDQNLPTCRRGDPIFQSRLNTNANGFKFKKSDNMTSADCRAKCLKNCSCVAFTLETGDNTTDCVIWSRGTKFYYTNNFSTRRYLYFIRETKENKIRPWLVIAIVGALLLLFCCLSYYARRKYKAKEEKWRMSLIIAVGVALLIPLLCYLCYLIWRKLKAEVQRIMNKRKLLRELGDNVSSPNTGGLGKTQEKDQSMNRELKIFNFQTIVSATNNFSTENKFGEGGFGPVYKGKLLDGQEIAIKRFSRRLGQGIVDSDEEEEVSEIKLENCSTNDVTISVMEAR